ncbi:MAG: hypothetical protein RJA61_289 [Candidatus Parcubacteria bacterium]|jgi:hypothetical protein
MLFQIATFLFATGLLVGVTYATLTIRKLLKEQLQTDSSTHTLIDKFWNSPLSMCVWGLIAILLLVVSVLLFGFKDCVQAGVKKITDEPLVANLIHIWITMSYYWALVIIVTLEADERKSLDSLTIFLIMGTITGIISTLGDSIKPSS